MRTQEQDSNKTHYITTREWRTVALILMTYSLFGVASALIYTASPMIAFALLVISMVLHSSLTHEALHGHPSQNAFINALLVFPSLSFHVPYLRFKDTHLAHHLDEHLTDPFDDPETNFLDPQVWVHLSRSARLLLRINNTLLGRIIIGPMIGQLVFFRHDLKSIWRGNRRVVLGWLLHIPAAGMVIWWLFEMTSVPFWVFLVASYLALGILKIRTFAEHRAHEKARARSIIVQRRGLLSFLFLNNSFHAVHHAHPHVAWYDLPSLYWSKREYFEAKNEGYVVSSYMELVWMYFLRMKDPVPHPLWSRNKD